jgi:hypothetical protein
MLNMDKLENGETIEMSSDDDSEELDASQVCLAEEIKNEPEAEDPQEKV